MFIKRKIVYVTVAITLDFDEVDCEITVLYPKPEIKLPVKRGDKFEYIVNFLDSMGESGWIMANYKKSTFLDKIETRIYTFYKKVWKFF